MKRLFSWLSVLGLGVGIGLFLAGPARHLLSQKAPPASSIQALDESSRPAPKWQCPMHPQIISDRPGECPICNMKLVPMATPAPATPSSSPAPGGYAPLRISKEQKELLNLKLIEVKTATIAGGIRTTGRITYDETRLHHVHTRYEAYVDSLYADFTGKYVRKGEPLLSLYSPELLAAQSEYLIALHSQKSGSGDGEDAPDRRPAGVDLLASARQKLRLWNIGDADIHALEERGQPSETLKLYAPIAGYVIGKMAVHGMRVKPEDSLFDIVDLSRVWVLADVYEYELPRLKLGQSATMTLAYWPGRSWSGRISYIYPAVDLKTRTVKVRFDVANLEHALKADMYTDVTIAVEPHAALTVPEDAVLETGTRSLVFVAAASGQLEPREVTTGERAGGFYEIKRGLSAGDRVALGAAFLIDSESRLQAALSEMAAGPPDGGAELRP